MVWRCRPGQGDVGLLGIVGNVPHPRPARSGRDGLHGARVPVAEEVLDSRHEVVPVDAASDGDDGTTRPHVGGDKFADVCHGECFDISGEPLRRHAPGCGIVDLAKREDGPVGRVVLGPRQILEHPDYIAAHGHILNTFMDIVRCGQASDVFRANADPELYARTCISIFRDREYDCLASRSPEAAETLVEQLTTYMMKMIESRLPECP